MFARNPSGQLIPPAILLLSLLSTPACGVEPTPGAMEPAWPPGLVLSLPPKGHSAPASAGPSPLHYSNSASTPIPVHAPAPPSDLAPAPASDPALTQEAPCCPDGSAVSFSTC